MDTESDNMTMNEQSGGTSGDELCESFLELFKHEQMFLHDLVSLLSKLYHLCALYVFLA